MGDMHVYFCYDGVASKGAAGLNRIHYLAKALAYADIQSKILTLSDSNKLKNEMIDGIEYCYYSIRGNKYIKKYQEKIGSGRLILNLLKSSNLTKNDAVFIYATNCLFVEPIVNYCHRINIKCILDVVEWHQPFQYKNGRYSIRYLSSKRTLESLTVKAKNVIAISDILSDHLKAKGCNVEVLPPMCSTSNDIDDRLICNKDVQLIYPGVPFYKDSILSMLEGLSLLSSEELSRVSFHTTGISRKDLFDFLGDKSSLIDKLGKSLVFHGRIERSQLLKLYQKVDYLLLARPNNLLTRANFPSKVPELLSYGVIPVCNRVGDYYKYLNNGENAILFDTDSPEEIANVLRKTIAMTEEERLRMKIAARVCAKEKFDYHNWANKTKEYFCNLQ